MPKWFRSRIVAAALAACLGPMGPIDAHDMAMPMEVGHVHLQVSCSARAAADIDRGVSLLYSFWYDAARRSFQNAEAEQPECAMAWWGEAMSDWQQIERLPEGAELKAGQVAVARAKAARVRTPRETAYVRAVAIIFDPEAQPDPAARVMGFSNAMGAIANAYPQDHQAAILHALPLLSGELPDDPSLARSREALAILNQVLAVEPDNPGVIHFIIHATDNPRMAPLGLAAARRYANIAPASAHAQHMPGNIFARLGLWREDIASNLASKAAAEQPAVLHREAQNRLHAMEFLQYAYLQIGRDDIAQTLVTEAVTIRPDEMSPGFERYHDTMEAGFPTRQVLETRDWRAAEQLQPPASIDAHAQRTFYWAQAVGAGHLRDARAGEAADARYRATYTAAQMQVAQAHPSSMWTETQAWTLFAEGKTADAVALLRPLADDQDEVGKGEVELPAREMMADMLRLSGRLAEALAQYRLSLQTDPGRFNTLLDAGQVAEQLGLGEEAEIDDQLLLANASAPSPLSRTTLGPTRAFLAKAVAR